MLRTEHIIMRKSGSGTRAMGNLILEGLGMEESDLNVFAHLNDQEATRNLVEYGFGISMMSELAIRSRVAGGWMLAFDVPGVDASRHFCILRRKNVPLSYLAEKFFEFAAHWGEQNL